MRMSFYHDFNAPLKRLYPHSLEAAGFALRWKQHAGCSARSLSAQFTLHPLVPSVLYRACYITWGSVKAEYHNLTRNIFFFLFLPSSLFSSFFIFNHNYRGWLETQASISKLSQPRWLIITIPFSLLLSIPLISSLPLPPPRSLVFLSHPSHTLTPFISRALSSL
jgi:hypothetical protein